ncbi:cytochrome c peroxidase [Aliikangiella maris]|uniref:Cytochrome c peroxidase n=1 Tax=Aliikangiella maris TaxID=3162458 RepID=A0ABV3MV89_9GAMM
MQNILSIVVLCSVSCLTACDSSSETTVVTSNEEIDLRQLLKVPEHFAIPPIPDYNVPTREKIELGRRLFYDTKLSANQTQSCASCHKQSLAFSDGKVTPKGSTGEQLVRNSQGLANSAYHPTLTWANKVFLEIEDQLQVPIRADDPVELGVTPIYVDEVLARFNNDNVYIGLFANAFPESSTGATLNKIIQALATFCRTLISGDSPYDRYYQGDKTALTQQQLLGFQLFNGEKFEKQGVKPILQYITPFPIALPHSTIGLQLTHA